MSAIPHNYSITSRMNAALFILFVSTNVQHRKKGLKLHALPKSKKQILEADYSAKEPDYQGGKKQHLPRKKNIFMFRTFLLYFIFLKFILFFILFYFIFFLEKTKHNLIIGIQPKLF